MGFGGVLAVSRMPICLAAFPLHLVGQPHCTDGRSITLSSACTLLRTYRDHSAWHSFLCQSARFHPPRSPNHDPESGHRQEHNRGIPIPGGGLACLRPMRFLSGVPIPCCEHFFASESDRLLTPTSTTNGPCTCCPPAISILCFAPLRNGPGPTRTRCAWRT